MDNQTTQEPTTSPVPGAQPELRGNNGEPIQKTEPAETVAKPAEADVLIDFPDAMRAVIDGKKVTKLEWGNNADYAIMRDGWLQLHKAKDDKFYTWKINDGDLIGQDYVVIS